MKNGQRILLLIGCFWALLGSAQKDTNHHLWVNVIDAFTGQALSLDRNVKVDLLQLDSTVVSSAVCRERRDQGSGERQMIVTFSVPLQKDPRFLLRASAAGYATKYVPVTLFWNKRFAESSKDISLRRTTASDAAYQLGEAKVTATKIKFYNKGDTLVYNADAFQLQEGSMLDGLISQLPGAELKPDGQIFVNGKKVESLLLNGRNFFKNDNTVLLDNLPAYMVHRVEVYNQESETSKLLGHKVDEGQLVMDIKLKRQYSIGWIGNTEWGYGTEKRYLGRLFALRFTPQSRLSVYGNLNNVNDRRKPDGNGGWGDFDPSGGLTATKRGGFDYSVYDKRNRFRLEGDVNASYTNNDNQWGGTSTDFLSSGDVFNAVSSRQQTSSLNLSTNHNWKYTNQTTNNGASFSPWFSYSHNDYHSNFRNGTFGVKPLDNYAEVLDSLFSPEWTTTVRHLIRRNGQQARGNSDGRDVGASYWTFIKIPRSRDGFSIDGHVQYVHSKSGEFNHFTYNHLEQEAMQTDFRNRYNYFHQQNTTVKARLKYFWHWTRNIYLNPSYTLQFKRSEGNHSLYRLEFLPESEGKDLGWLPSQMESLLQALDADNSNESTLNNWSHQLTLDWQWNKYVKDENYRTLSSWNVTVRPSLVYETNRFDYRSANDPQHLTPGYWLPQFYFQLKRGTPSLRHQLNFDFSLTTSAPSITSLLRRTDTADPLHITLGNPNLKRKLDGNVSFNYRADQWLQRKERQLYGSVGWHITHNALAASYTYNRKTGVTTTQTVNVDGNWNAWMNLNFTLPIDRQHRLMFTTASSVSFYHTVDYASSREQEHPIRTTTQATITSETLRLNYRYNYVNFGLTGAATYNHQASTLEGYASPNTWNVRYGLHAVVDLPWRLQLSSDLTMFTRRGYESTSMNRDDLVWNARLSKSLWKNQLTLMVDAWDILGNLSNVNVGMNSRSMWEYYTNVIPRYAMFRLVYRLNRQPKKK